MFFQDVVAPAALSERIIIQTCTSTRGAFGPEEPVWTAAEERWGAIVNAPMGLGPTRQDKTFDDHRRKKKSGCWLILRHPFSFVNSIGFADHTRFKNKRTGLIYVLDLVDWVPGAETTGQFVSIPVIVSAAEQANG